MLDIRYTNDHPSDYDIYISFLERMKSASFFFKFGETTHIEWLKILQEDKYKNTPDVISEGKRTMIVVSHDNAY